MAKIWEEDIPQNATFLEMQFSRRHVEKVLYESSETICIGTSVTNRPAL